MEREFERKTKSQSAHSFESKQRTEDVKTGEELSFSDLHISKNVLKGINSNNNRFLADIDPRKPNSFDLNMEVV